MKVQILIGGGKSIFASAVCMMNAEQQSKDNNEMPSSHGSSNSNFVADVTHFSDTGLNFQPGEVGYNDSNHHIEFPSEKAAAGCGWVSWDLNGSCKSASSTDCMESKQIMISFIEPLISAAKNYYCSANKEVDSCRDTVVPKDLDSENADLFFNAMLGFINLATPLMNRQERKTNDEKEDNLWKLIKDSKIDGWMMAGRYYWDITHIRASDYDIGHDAGKLMGKTNSGEESDAYKLASKKSKDYLPMILQDNDLYKYDAEKRVTTNIEIPQIHDDKGKASNFLKDMIVISKLKDLEGKFTHNSSMEQDPIEFLFDVGRLCMKIAGDYWFGGIIGVLLILVAGSTVCPSVFSIGQLVLAGVKIIQPLLMLIGGIFFAMGVTLSIYVPLYPYIIYLFTEIGWLVLVIESMVAVPLICLGLTHPEGHDFLGEAKQALMLTLGIFLRPSLMVIGLVGGMIVSYVSLGLVSYTFSGVTKGIFQSFADDSGTNFVESAFEVLFVQPMFYVMFTIVVTKIVTYSYKLIYLLPDNIMRWIGGPQHSSEAGAIAGEVKSEASSTASQLAQMGDKSMETANQGAEALPKHAKEIFKKGNFVSGED